MGPETSPTAVAAQLQQQLAQWGLDIVHPFTPQLFNAHCPADNALPTFGRASTAALLVGNSKQLWDPFLRHLAAHPEQLTAANPLDDYVQTALVASLADCGLALVPEVRPSSCSKEASHTASNPNNTSTWQQHQHQHQQQEGAGIRCHVRYSHFSGALFVNVLRVAELSRLAYYSPVTHLCLHPTFGPWFALRAVIILDCEGGTDFLAMAPAPAFPGVVDPAVGNQQQQQQQQQQQGGGVQEDDRRGCKGVVVIPTTALGTNQQQQQQQQQQVPLGPLPCPYPALEEEAGAAMAALKAAGGLATWQQHWRDWAGLRRLAGRHVGDE
jgi:hypothetical protein